MCFQLNFKGNKPLDRQRMGVTGNLSCLSDLSYSCERTAGSGHGSASSVLVSESPVVARSFTCVLFLTVLTMDPRDQEKGMARVGNFRFLKVAGNKASTEKVKWFVIYQTICT